MVESNPPWKNMAKGLQIDRQTKQTVPNISYPAQRGRERETESKYTSK